MFSYLKLVLFIAVLILHLPVFLTAQPGASHSKFGGHSGDRKGHHPPPMHPMRKHSANQVDEAMKLYPATEKPIAENRYTETLVGEWRVFKSNGIAEHLTGEFPNSGNPNAIREQNAEFRVPADPILLDQITPVKECGWTIEGVPFDPGAAEFYKGDPSLGWQYEALSGAVSLGLDENHAHVQPGGKYHYHGLPTLLMKDLGVNPSEHSPIIGWAVDGFPIYALYGFADLTDPDSDIVEMTSSYQLKKGERPSGDGQPGGTYDGTFTADYEYVEGSGHLDECNGRITVTPDFPDGTYAYYLTNTWPVVPRCVHGLVDESQHRRPEPPPHMSGGYGDHHGGHHPPPHHRHGGHGGEDGMHHRPPHHGGGHHHHPHH
jgi:hypothetical protein